MPVYQSSTIVQVSQGQLLSRDMQRLLPGVSTQERLANLRKLISSHEYLKRLITTLDLYNDPQMRLRAEEGKNNYPGLSIDEITELLWIDQLKKFLNIRQTGSDFIEISAYGNTPNFAYNFAHTLTQIFIDESLRREVGGIRGALEFSSEQLEVYRKKLANSEDKLRKYQEKILYDNVDDQSLASTNHGQANKMLTATELELRDLKDRFSFLQNQVRQESFGLHSINSSKLRSLKSELLQSAADLARLMIKYSWQDAEVLKLNTEIDNLHENIRSEINSELRQSYSHANDRQLEILLQKEIVSIDIDFLNHKKTALTSLINELKRTIGKAPSRELELNRLRGEVEANRRIYETILQQNQGSEIEEALQRTAAEFKFRIIEPAIKPIKPIKPNRVKLMLMAIAVGCAIGGGIIFLLEYMDHSFKKVEDIEKYLDLPVLGTIPRIDMESSKKYY